MTAVWWITRQLFTFPADNAFWFGDLIQSAFQSMTSSVGATLKTTACGGTFGATVKVIDGAGVAAIPEASIVSVNVNGRNMNDGSVVAPVPSVGAAGTVQAC